MHQTTRSNQPFDIRVWVEHDKSGRAPCPCCLQDGKTKQKNLSIDLSTGAYHCWRGCTSAQIREVLGVPKGVSSSNSPSSQQQLSQSISSQPRTVPQKQVYQSQQRLLGGVGRPQEQALTWLESRGFTRETIAHYHLGLEQKWVTPDENNPHVRECYWSVAIYIPAAEPGQFYKKLRIAPGLTGEDRPHNLPKWSQYGVPATIFYTYRPDSAEATWFCEGEWDAMRLGWLAGQLNAKVAVCCSTAGCGTVPRQEQLDRLPGQVIIFFDRNDKPTKDGSIPGDEGAKKLALALGDRGRIARVPMPESCEIEGWDVSNALDAGFAWEDFQIAATTAALPKTEPQPTAALSPHSSRSEILRERILEILARHETPFQREIALMTLARETGYSYRNLDSLAESLATEVDFQFDRDEAANSLQNLIKTRRTQLDLKRYLEPWFAEAMLETARAMPTAPEFLFTTLLAAAASRVGTAARVVIKPSAKYTQPMVFWSAIVANSGSMKTPAQRVVLDPLIALEKEAYEIYQLELADYKAAEAQKGKKQNGTEEEAIPQPPVDAADRSSGEVETNGGEAPGSFSNLRPEQLPEIQWRQSLKPTRSTSIDNPNSDEMTQTLEECQPGRSERQPSEPANSKRGVAESTTRTVQFQRGDALEVLIEGKWVPATYIRQIHMVFSHQTRRLEEGHQVSVSNGFTALADSPERR